MSEPEADPVCQQFLAHHNRCLVSQKEALGFAWAAGKALSQLMSLWGMGASSRHP
jgi:hypothetical protein